MKKLATLIVLLAILASGCKYIEKKRLFSKSADTLLNYEETQDTSDFYTGLNDINTEPDTMKNIVPSTTSFASKKAYMIVGSFLIPQNADKYAQKIRSMGYNTEIVILNNFHMVAASAYDNLRDGVKDIPKYRAEINEKAWVYLKE